MTRLDRVICWISPQWAMRRLQARAFADVASLAYDGGRKGRSTNSWFTSGADANAENAPYLATLRNRCRDLYRNSSYARKIIDEYVNRGLGTGIPPRSKAKQEAVARRIDERFERWAEIVGYYQLQRKAAKTVYESGEALIRHRTVSKAVQDKFRLPVPYWPILLEPDHIDTDKSQNIGTSKVINGVQFSEDDVIEGYWLFDTHPGANLPIVSKSAGVSKFVEAKWIEHGALKDRATQARGTPKLAPVIMPLQHLADWQDATRIARKIQACLAVFITRPEGATSGTLGNTKTNSAKDKRLEEINPGMIEYLKPGESVAFLTPPGSEADVDYVRIQVREIAAGAGIPYELLGDLSQVNYSSYRGGAIGFRDALAADVWMVMIPFFGTPIHRKFVESLVVAGEIEAGNEAVEWSPPPFNLLDRQAEVEADTEELQNGSLTWPQLIHSKGLDPEKQLAEISEWKKKFELAGVDPTTMIPSGGKKDAGTKPVGRPKAA